MASTSTATASSPWPRRLAWALVLCALPLTLFGGSVTTLRAGMAIDGWLVLEPGRGDHFLPFYPVEKWLRDAGTFTEHTHRLLGVLVGLSAVAYLLSAALRERQRDVLVLAVVSLAAVCVQGTLGGFRVLENSPELAFLHAAFAQAVLALLGANLVVTSRAWRELARQACDSAASARRWSWVAVTVVCAQVVLGAWLRHSGAALPFGLHLGAVLAVTVTVLGTAQRLGRLHAELARRGHRTSHFLALRRWLVFLLVAEIVLGVLATISVLVFSGGFLGEVSLGEMIFATAHVLFGALLLGLCLAAALWTQRLAPLRGRLPIHARPSLGGLR